MRVGAWCILVLGASWCLVHLGGWFVAGCAKKCGLAGLFPPSSLGLLLTSLVFQTTYKNQLFFNICTFWPHQARTHRHHNRGFQHFGSSAQSGPQNHPKVTPAGLVSRGIGLLLASLAFTKNKWCFNVFAFWPHGARTHTGIAGVVVPPKSPQSESGSDGFSQSWNTSRFFGLQKTFKNHWLFNIFAFWAHQARTHRHHSRGFQHFQFSAPSGPQYQPKVSPARMVFRSFALLLTSFAFKKH